MDMSMIYQMFADAIVAGTYFFKNVCKRLRKVVAEALKRMGREDLATDSNAEPKGEE